MNDPFECLSTLERNYNKSELQKFRNSFKKSNDNKWNKLTTCSDETLTEIINKLRKEALNRFAFCSFTEDPNNILMWSHYANKHSGIVIGFDFPDANRDHNFQKVSYKDKLNNIDLKALANLMIGEDESYLNQLVNDYSIKSQHWAYEKEWRVWRDQEGYFKYEPEQIKEIHFGVRTPLEIKAVIVNLLHFLPKNFKFTEKEITNNPIGLK